MHWLCSRVEDSCRVKDHLPLTLIKNYQKKNDNFDSKKQKSLRFKPS